MRALRIAMIGSSRFPIAEPFVGGLESYVSLLSQTLRERGHHVTLFAAVGSDRGIADRLRHLKLDSFTGISRLDLSHDPRLVAAEDLAYRRAMGYLARHGAAKFDVVHDNSLHPVPKALARQHGVRTVSTLHTPPVESVVRTMISGAAGHTEFVAVSQHTARSWAAHSVDVGVILNGVNVDRWKAGPGGDRLIWFGRLVPEKGAELAIAAARLAGYQLDLAGPIGDPQFFTDRIAPQLDEDIRYLGHLDQKSLADVVGRSRVAVVTPRWDEPYGLVVAESLACGTPVAAFARGGIPEIVTRRTARLAAADDVKSLADAIDAAAALDRSAARAHAVKHLSIHRMVDAYERLYRRCPAKLATTKDIAV